MICSAPSQRLGSLDLMMGDLVASSPRGPEDFRSTPFNDFLVDV